MELREKDVLSKEAWDDGHLGARERKAIFGAGGGQVIRRMHDRQTLSGRVVQTLALEAVGALVDHPAVCVPGGYPSRRSVIARAVCVADLFEILSREGQALVGLVGGRHGRRLGSADGRESSGGAQAVMEIFGSTLGGTQSMREAKEMHLPSRASS